METKCPICGKETPVCSDTTGYFAKFIDCTTCGKFYMEDGLLEKVCKSIKYRSVLFHYLTQKHHSEIIPHFHNYQDWEDGINNNRQFININNLLNLYPKNFNEKINMIILNIGTLIKFVGDTFEIELDNNSYLFPLFFIDESFGEQSLETQFEETVSILKELGYIKCSYELGGNKEEDTLTVLGWDLLNKLQEENTSSKTAFIAMWFDDSMEKAKEKIRKTISDCCGYAPIIISMKEHNNQIVPEIFYEIKQAKFIVADITGHRNGVYYEAGYGEALGKQVIITCKESDFENRHFDIAQKNTIVWKDEEDLGKRLYKRIEATAGVIK